MHMWHAHIDFLRQSDLCFYVDARKSNGVSVMAEKNLKLNEYQCRVVRAGLMSLRKSYERAVVKYQAEEKPEMAEIMRKQLSDVAALSLLF